MRKKKPSQLSVDIHNALMNSGVKELEDYTLLLKIVPNIVRVIKKYVLTALQSRSKVI